MNQNNFFLKRYVTSIFIVALLIFSLALTQVQVKAQDNPIDSSNPPVEKTVQPTSTPSEPTEPAVHLESVPSPVAPVGTISDFTPTYKWKRVSGATQYSFSVYKGATLIFSKLVASSSCGTDATYCTSTPTNTLTDNSYTWKVRAYASGVWQAYSTPVTFKLVTIPTLSSPTGTVSDPTPTYKWTRILNATQYGLVLYKGSTTVYTQSVATSACGSSSTICQFTPTTSLPDASYTWKVRAYVGNIWQAYSGVTSFKLVTVSTLYSPYSTISDSTPSYKWTRIANATQYNLVLVRGTSTTYSLSIATSACGSSATYCVTVPSTILKDGGYKWKVRAYANGMWLPFSNYNSFALATVPAPKSPKGIISSTTPTFTWSPVLNATQYVYSVRDSDGGITQKTVNAANVCTTSVCSGAWTTPLAMGNYDWYVQAYIGGVWSSNSATFNFTVNVNPYTGSGLLDGEGIPTDFFADIHIRKAFSYCMDWDTLITDEYAGDAVQSIELFMPDTVGYDPDVPHYTFDLTQAEDEFKLADLDHDDIAAGEETDGTDVWSTGFYFKIPYYADNPFNQKIAEILAANLHEVNPKFNADIVGLTWSEFLSEQNEHRLPILLAGWAEDIHDPHNWAQTYTVGIYAREQNMPDDLKAQFSALVNQGVAEPDPVDRNSTYSQLSQLYYDEVPGVPVVLSYSHVYENRSIKSQILNPLTPNYYFYGWSKDSTSSNPTSLRFETNALYSSLDPARAYDTASSTFIQNIYETLVYLKGDSTRELIPQLATAVPTVDNGGISEDGKTIVFNIRSGVKFQNGDAMTASDVAYSLQRGILQGGSSSPQWLLTEAFFGSGITDITQLVDPSGVLLDDRYALKNANPDDLLSACQQVQDAIVADDTAGTVTLNLSQSWAPLLPALAQTVGSVMDKSWVIDNGGWDGNCETWQNYYDLDTSEDTVNDIANGTGPYAVDSIDSGNQVVLKSNTNYWRVDPAYDGGPSGVPSITSITIASVPDWDTRFADFQSGVADLVFVPGSAYLQMDSIVGETCVWNPDTGAYDACSVDDDSLPIRLFADRPLNTNQTVILYNFNIQ